VSLGGSFSGKTKLKSGSRPAGEVSSAEFDHEASYEFDLPNGATLSVGHSLHGSYFELPEHNVATALPKRLQSAQVELAYSQSWNDRVNAFVSLSPGLRWAGSDTGAGSFGVGGGAGAFYRYSDTLSLMLGVGFDSMAHHKVMPGVGVQWAPSERVECLVRVPPHSRHMQRQRVAEPLAGCRGGIRHLPHREGSAAGPRGKAFAGGHQARV
jgi:hypothetical protein